MSKMKGYTYILLLLLTSYVFAEEYSDNERRTIKLRKARRRRPIKSDEELKMDRALFNVRVDKKPGVNSYIIQNENTVQPIKPSKTTYYVNVTGTQERPFFGGVTTPSVTKEPSITILVSGESSTKPEDDILQTLLKRIQAIRDQKNQNAPMDLPDDEPIVIEDLTDGVPKPIQLRSDTIINRRPVSYSGLLDRLTTTPKPRTTSTTTKRVMTQRKPVEVVDEEVDEADDDGFKPGTYVWVNNKKVLKEDFAVLSGTVPENELTKKAGEADDSGEYYDYVYYYDDDGVPTTTTKRPTRTDKMTTRRVTRPTTTSPRPSLVKSPVTAKIVSSAPIRSFIRQQTPSRLSTTQRTTTPRTAVPTTTKTVVSNRPPPFVQSGYANVKAPPEQGTEANRVAQTSIILSPANRLTAKPLITATKETTTTTPATPATTTTTSTTTTTPTTTTTTAPPTTTTTTTTTATTTTSAATTTTTTSTTASTTAATSIAEKRTEAVVESAESHPEELQKIVDSLMEKGAITPTSSTKKPVAMEDILKIAAGLIPIGSAALAAAYSQGKFGPKVAERLDADEDQPNFWSFLTGSKRDRDHHDRIDHEDDRPELHRRGQEWRERTDPRPGRQPIPYPSPADHMRIIERLDRRPVTFDRDPILERIPIERGPIFDRPPIQSRPTFDQSFEPSRPRPVTVERRPDMPRVEKPKETTEREVDIVTAPEHFNMIVSSSLNGDGEKMSPNKHHGYIVDGNESRELIQIPPPRELPQEKVDSQAQKKPEVVMITAQDALSNKPQELQSLVGLLAHIYTTSAPILGSPKTGERPFMPGNTGYNSGVNIVPFGETGYNSRESEETKRFSTTRQIEFSSGGQAIRPTEQSSDEKLNESVSAERNRSVEDMFSDVSREMSFDLTSLYERAPNKERGLQKSHERIPEERYRVATQERNVHQTNPPERKESEMMFDLTSLYERAPSKERGLQKPHERTPEEHYRVASQERNVLQTNPPERKESEMTFDLTSLYERVPSKERSLPKPHERNSEERYRVTSQERNVHQTNPPERKETSRERYSTSQERPSTTSLSRFPTTLEEKYPSHHDSHNNNGERFEDRSDEFERTAGIARESVAMSSQKNHVTATPEYLPSTPPSRVTPKTDSSERTTTSRMTTKPDSNEQRDSNPPQDLNDYLDNLNDPVDESDEMSDEEKVIIVTKSISSTTIKPTSTRTSTTSAATAELTRATKKPKRKESYFDETAYNKNTDSDESNLQTYYDAVPNDVRSKFGPTFVNEKPAVDFDEEGYSDQEEPPMNSLTTEQMIYLLIGSLCGFSLICLGLVFLTMRCRTRSMYSSSWCPCSDSFSDSMSDSLDSRSNRSSRTVISQKVKNQLHDSKGGVGATHKLGTWFNGRNTIAVFDENGKPRNQMALPNFSSSVSKKSTKAYFTDGRSGSTRDLVAQATPPSPQSSDISEQSRKSREKKPGQGSSWLHKEYDEKAHASEATASLAHGLAYYKEKTDEVSDNERPRSSATTLKAPPHFRASNELESDAETTVSIPTVEESKPKLHPKPKRASSPPPQLPPKKRDALKSEDPTTVGSHLTLQTEASSHAADSMSVMSSVYGQGRMGYWTSVKDARIL